jgi:hypothetical protein
MKPLIILIYRESGGYFNLLLDHKYVTEVDTSFHTLLYIVKKYTLDIGGRSQTKGLIPYKFSRLTRHKKYQKRSYSFTSSASLVKENLASHRWFSSSLPRLVTKQLFIASGVDKLKFNQDDMAALSLPPFQEIFDIVKSSGDLTIDYNTRVLIRDITGSDFYKELYKTIDNLEPGGYSISFCFYTFGVSPRSGLLYFNVGLDNNLSLPNQNYRSMGYVR